MNGPIRVGVVGCGEIAQIMHLRFLEELPDFQIEALCDISESVLASLGDRYRVKQLFTDYAELVELDGLDAVVVCTPDHVGPVRAALAAGKHVFCEKPLAFDVTEARELAELSRRSSSVAMVGYMRLFDPAYEYAQSLLASMGPLKLVEAHDFMARFDKHSSLFPLVLAPRPEATGGLSSGDDDGKDRVAALARSVGDDAATQALYWNMLMGASHDVSLLRGTFGLARDILFAASDAPGRLIACLRYEGDVQAVLTVDILAAYNWWDQYLRVYGAAEVLTLTFANPYKPYVPTLVTRRSGEGEERVEASVVVSDEPPFRRQWRHFAECIRSGAPPRSTFGGAADDIQVIAELVLAAAPTRG